MGNYITITTANDFQLPEEIIQHIQSKIQYSSEKEAARTTLVSKSWYCAWSTRPDLVFNPYYFPPSRANLFWEFAMRTMKRYEHLNLNIRSLKLVMTGLVSRAMAKELILRAIKLGVVDLTIQNWNEVFVLPHEVLQSKTLARLNLIGFFTINLEKERVTCHNLKSLKLKHMALNDVFFRDMISRCPLIEEFTLASYSKTVDDAFLNKLLDQFPKLKSLSLGVKYASPPHRHDLFAKFACIKKLKIDDYNSYDDLRIRIPSLEHITLSIPKSNVNVEFDFPNIRKFKMRGCLLQRFELKTSTTRRDEWESKVNISYDEYMTPSGEWFSRLSQFVRMLSLSRSRVSLSICTTVGNWDEFTYHPTYFGDGLAIPAVEKLTLYGFQAVTPAFLDAIFWNCRPKYVEIQNNCLFGMKKVNVEEFQQFRSLPWETFYNVSSGYGCDVRFHLN